LPPSGTATLFPIGLLVLTMGFLLLPLLTLPRLLYLALSIRRPEVYAFDCNTREFERRGRVIAPLDNIERVRIEKPSFAPEEGKARYRLSIILTLGRSVTIWIDGFLSDELRVHQLAQQIADHIGVEVERESGEGIPTAAERERNRVRR